MNNLSHEDSKRILETIDNAFLVHTKWFEDLTRMLLCKLPLRDSYVAKDAHKKCEFGCWLYSSKNRRLRDLPAFVKIEELHEKMHDSAKEMCLKMKATGMIREEDYDYFIRNMTAFRNELAEFRQRVSVTMDQVQNNNK